MTWAAAIVGFVTGAAAAMLWTCLARWFDDKAFWPTVHKTCNVLKAADVDEFVRQYIKLIRALGTYVVKSTVRVGLTVLPVFVTLMAFSPFLEQWQLRQAHSLIAYPRQPLVIRTSQQVLPQRDGTFPWVFDETNSITLEKEDWSTAVSCAATVVLTNSWLTQTTFQLSGFRTVLDPSAPALLLLRPAADEANPLWPYLNDLEFTFWMSLIVASIGVGVVTSIGWPAAAKTLSRVSAEPCERSSA